MNSLEANFSVRQTYGVDFEAKGSVQCTRALVLKVCKFIKENEGKILISPEHMNQVHSILGEKWSKSIDNIIRQFPHPGYADWQYSKNITPFYKEFCTSFPLSKDICEKTKNLINQSLCFLVLENYLCRDAAGRPVDGMILEGEIKDTQIRALFNEKIIALGIKHTVVCTKICCIAKVLIDQLDIELKLYRAYPHPDISYPRSTYTSSRSYGLYQPLIPKKKRGCCQIL
jgi:hypothetical protein